MSCLNASWETEASYDSQRQNASLWFVTFPVSSLFLSCLHSHISQPSSALRGVLTIQGEVCSFEKKPKPGIFVVTILEIIFFIYWFEIIIFLFRDYNRKHVVIIELPVKFTVSLHWCNFQTVMFIVKPYKI